MSEQENVVRCDECGSDNACYTVSVMMGGEVTQRHLCPDCMAKMNMNLSAGNVAKMLSAILGALTGHEEKSAPDVPPEEDVVCERCGTALSGFVKSGKLGCPMCYKAFAERLTPMLQQIHGRVQHAGRKPTQDPAAQMHRKQVEDLNRQLEMAVQVEDYESAAMIRDQLRLLNQEGGEG